MTSPVRSRVASARPAVREQAESSITPPLVPAVSKPSAPSSDIYDISDREKERLKRKRASDAAAITADETEHVPHGLEMTAEQTQALEDSKRKRDAAMDRLANITSTSSAGRGRAVESPHIEYSRRDESAVSRALPRLTDASGLDLDDDSLFGKLDDTLEDSHEAIEETTQNGHRSTDTSSFNIGLFKRRPRQSSIVGKDDAPIRPSSRGPNTSNISSTLNLGMFRRRAREPSILGTAQKERAPRPQSQASRYGSVAGDDSGPDDESTPLNLAKRRSERHSQRVVAADASSREASPILPSRKRKSLEDQGGREKRPALEPEDDIHQSIEVDSSSSSVSFPSPSPPRQLDQERFSTPDHRLIGTDPDMAPPLSSGSSDASSSVVWPSLDSLAHRTYYHARKTAPSRPHKTPEPGAAAEYAASDISSPPSLTHSPNYVAPKPKAKRKPSAPAKATTTADLTSLLPRRRHKSTKSKNRDHYGLTSSDGEGGHDGDENDDDEEEETAHEEDDDELSYMANSRAAAAARRKKKKAAAASAAALPLGRSLNGNRGARGKGKEAQAASVSAQKKRPGLRTYGSRNSDKENENEESIEAGGDGGEGGESDGAEDEAADDEEEQRELDPETSQMMLERLGEELKSAAKKFKEVDQWELSYEEVTGSSSPVQNAR
ncbi:hypothetical protein B0T24DRAFT_650875 [Lasiosphaeria ovina]|uniref:Uncharacterized protein n=1 Tax=Lasiosphaeria ovina TaxID=92902 RepID=A0AAE0K321_9PEZI|nr:hypothetical protein B0T24DRAFT_650875 [Lasiosphaeria ovina]